MSGPTAFAQGQLWWSNTSSGPASVPSVYAPRAGGCGVFCGWVIYGDCAPPLRGTSRLEGGF